MRPVIVEGPDGNGKTYLVQRLIKDLATVGIMTGSAAKSFDELNSRMGQMIRLADLSRELPAPIIFDRCCHISEMIYPMITGRDQLAPLAYLSSHLVGLDPVLVYCRRKSARIGDVRKQFWEDAQAKAKGHKPVGAAKTLYDCYPELIFEYDKAFNRLDDLGFSIIHYDFEADDYDTFLETVKFFAGKRCS
jgi:hypothetical protein